MLVFEEEFCTQTAKNAVGSNDINTVFCSPNTGLNNQDATNALIHLAGTGAIKDSKIAT